MRWLGVAVAWGGMVVGLAGVGTAQGPDPLTAPLARGPLVVWAVTAGDGRLTPQQRQAGARPPLPVMLPPNPVIGIPNTIQEQTAASFGTPASQVGQTAASYGQTAGSVGTPAAEYGIPAGEHGQTAASFGQTAGSVGQTAASYGQTAGSFGQTAGSYGVGLSDMNAQALAMRAAATAPRPAGTVHGVAAFWQEEIRRRFEASAVRMVEVKPENLQAELQRTAGTAEAPDVLLGEPLPAVWWMNLAGQWGMTELARDRPLSVVEVQAGEASSLGQPTEVAVLKNTAHPEQAMAFAVMVADGERCEMCGQRFAEASPEGVAERAFTALLMGSSYGGDADLQAAPSDAAMTQRLIFRVQEIPTGTRARVDAMSSRRSARLAVVGLRAELIAPGGFGVVHGVAVLRPDQRGNWRVLAVASNVPPAAGGEMLELLAKAGAAGVRTRAVKLVGISQAAPLDGDNRSPRPELWWDPGAGAVMQVIEWQRGDGTAWSSSQLQLVPDAAPRLRTRVRAEFATGGLYRWRVWSVAGDGAMVISPWRRLNIVR